MILTQGALIVWWVISVAVRVLLVWSLFGGCLAYFSWLIKPEEFTIDPRNPLAFMKRLVLFGILLYVFHFVLPT